MFALQQIKPRKGPNGNKIVAPAVYPSKRAEVRYRYDLNGLIRQMADEVQKVIVPDLRRYEALYVVQDQSFVVGIQFGISAVEAIFKAIIEPFSKTTAERMVNTEAEDNTKKFDKGIQRSTGVNLGRIISTEALAPTLDAKVAENIALIKSIPEEYFKKLNGIIFNSISEGSTAGGIVKQIQALTGVTYSRAKLIARDQTAKTNGAINMTRQQNLGVEEYVWETSKDERVRPTHRSKQGKIFRWDDPPSDTGPPSHDVRCRCQARAVINLENL